MYEAEYPFTSWNGFTGNCNRLARQGQGHVRADLIHNVGKTVTDHKTMMENGVLSSWVCSSHSEFLFYKSGVISCPPEGIGLLGPVDNCQW